MVSVVSGTTISVVAVLAESISTLFDAFLNINLSLVSKYHTSPSLGELGEFVLAAIRNDAAAVVDAAT